MTSCYKPEMEKRETTFVSLRLDAELVRMIDRLADVEHLTRTAVIERLAWREFKAARFVAPLSILKQAVQGIGPATPGDDPLCEWLLSGPPAFERWVEARQPAAKRKGRAK